MPPKKSTEAQADGDAEKRIVTENDMKILSSIFTHSTIQSKPIADWDTCAAELNFKSGKTARDRFNQIINKYKWFTVNQESDTGKNGDAATGSSATPKKQTAGKRGRGIKQQYISDPDDEDDDKLDSTPTKKRKPNAKKAAHKAKAVGQEGIDVTDETKKGEEVDAKEDIKAEDDIDPDA
ncbi:hypothetical protein F4809DRAFT_604420 [Biscogniauxia mediterranea]|nr:hypothetical protein F4809DRAFT_604420 [Biscogniauxia mediterranea]